MATEFISRKYGTEGYEVIIKTDSHEHYKASEEFARRLINHAKPMTNADRIRSMSDKELAFWLAERYVKEAVLQLKDKGVTPSATDIREVEERLYMVWARWLQQPAEEL